MSSIISMDKKYKTRDGRAVRLLCTDGPGIYPIIGLIGGNPITATWNIKGLYSTNQVCRHDLVEDKPKIKLEYWLNISRNKNLYFYFTEANARFDAELRTQRGEQFFATALPYTWEEEAHD
jgi:hypothetical protein